jgi:hypothetical protein
MKLQGPVPGIGYRSFFALILEKIVLLGYIIKVLRGV